MKWYSVILMFFYFSVTLAQGNSKVPAFLDPKIDTVALINCSQETLDTIVGYIRRNPKFVIDHNISCNAKVVFTILKDFSIETLVTGERDIEINLVFRDKVSKKYSDQIRKYYIDQSRFIARNLYGIFIPTRVNGEYYPTQFYLNIDFTKDAGAIPPDSLKTKEFKASEFSAQTIVRNEKLRSKGIELLKNKNPQLAFIYFRMAYFINKDIESVVLLGNLWNVMGEPETACKTWKIAADKENKQAQELIKNCKE